MVSTRVIGIIGIDSLLGRFIKAANDSPRAEVKPEVIDKTGLRGIYEFRFVFEGTVGGGLLSSSTPPEPRRRRLSALPLRCPSTAARAATC